MKQRFVMTEKDYNKLLVAVQPVPYIVVGGIPPRSVQERANDAWAELGGRMGFKHMTVQPDGSDRLAFTAEPVE